MAALDFVSLGNKNKRKSIVLVSLLIVFFLYLGIFLDKAIQAEIPVFTLSLLSVAVIRTITAYLRGDKKILKLVGARPVNPDNYKERMLINLVEELSIAAGIPKPEIYVMDVHVPNAFATGRSPQYGKICVTSGLLNMMSREELSGVIAHEISHIKNYDILYAMLTAVLLGTFVAFVVFAQVNLFVASQVARSVRSRKGNELILMWLLASIALFVIFVIAKFIGMILSLAVSRAREYLADAGSVEITRNPLALASALEKIANYPYELKVKEQVAHLFFTEPSKRDVKKKVSFWKTLWSTHPAIEKRIEILKKMAGAY
ncbi:MAG: M48 family metallopeptidase [candidate division WOR-3 bacterium]